MKHTVCFLLLSATFLAVNTAVSPADDAVIEEGTPLLPQLPVGIAFRGPDFPNVKTVFVKSQNVYDYVFEKAPSDWWVQSGKWEMTNRWTYAPGWSWFGGRSEEIAAIWNKRKFSGDFSVQFYFAFKQGMTRDNYPNQMEHPSDAAISFCGDGTNLGSGYSFIIGANNNTRTILMKQGKVVTESAAPDALLLSYTDGRVTGYRQPWSSSWPVSNTQPIKTEPKKADEPRMTTHIANSGFGIFRPYSGLTNWSYAKVNKIGNRIECWLDENLLFTYEDAAPFDAGQFALWTMNNGIVLSRVQIYYENEIKRSFIKKLENSEPIDAVVVSEPLPVVNAVP